MLDRNPCGSSSGSAVAVAARLAPLAVGTETDGSIVCPAAANGVVGVKPTLGLVSGRGIVPIAKSQDTAGPFARTVRDAALLLSVLAEPDAGGRVAALPKPRRPARRRARRSRACGSASCATTRAPGATPRPRRLSRPRSSSCARRAPSSWIRSKRGSTRAVEAAELQVLLHEFRVQIDEYLDAVHGGPRSLEELIEYDIAHAAEVMPFFAQDLLIAAHATEGLDAPRYRDAVGRASSAFVRASRALFADRRLDALVAPANSRAWRDRLGRGRPLRGR